MKKHSHNSSFCDIYDSIRDSKSIRKFNSNSFPTFFRCVFYGFLVALATILLEIVQLTKENNKIAEVN